MGRRLFNILAAISLVLCLATAALWVRSYAVAQDLSFRTRSDWIEVMCSRGMFFMLHHASFPRALDSHPRFDYSDREPVDIYPRNGVGEWHWWRFFYYANHADRLADDAGRTGQQLTVTQQRLNHEKLSQENFNKLLSRWWSLNKHQYSMALRSRLWLLGFLVWVLAIIFAIGPCLWLTRGG